MGSIEKLFTRRVSLIVYITVLTDLVYCNLCNQPTRLIYNLIVVRLALLVSDCSEYLSRRRGPLANQRRTVSSFVDNILRRPLCMYVCKHIQYTQS